MLLDLASQCSLSFELSYLHCLRQRKRIFFPDMSLVSANAVVCARSVIWSRIRRRLHRRKHPLPCIAVRAGNIFVVPAPQHGLQRGPS